MLANIYEPLEEAPRFPDLSGDRVVIFSPSQPILERLEGYLSGCGGDCFSTTDHKAVGGELAKGAALLVFDVSESPPAGMNSLTSVLSDLAGEPPPVIAVGTVEIFEEEFRPVGKSLVGRVVKPIRERELARILRVWKNPEGESSDSRHTEKPDVDHQIAKKNPLNILVIDEKAISRKVLMMNLASFGYRADGVEDIDLARESMRRRAYDLIFLGEEESRPISPEEIQALRDYHSEESGWSNPLEIYLCSARNLEDFDTKGGRDLVDGVLRRPARWHSLRELLSSEPNVSSRKA
jgi:DNA-binding response OmpR family regulator